MAGAPAGSSTSTNRKRVRESGGKDADAVQRALDNWETMEEISRQAGLR
jgi:hypothetical protein